MDRGGSVDPSHAFVVALPWWGNPWVLGVAGVLLGLVGVQTVRVVRRGQRLQRANASLRDEIAERERAEAERARLDTQLRDLRYLYRLREALGEARSADEAIQAAGEAVMAALSASGSAGVVIELDGRPWSFGSAGGNGNYERALAWGGKARGQLRLTCGVTLSQAQEHVLLDETAGQLAHALETRELQMQVLQSSRLVSLGEMAAGVAHELSQPLSVVSTTAGDICYRLFRGQEVPKEQLDRMIRDLLEVVGRMDGTVDHLRLFSRDTWSAIPCSTRGCPGGGTTGRRRRRRRFSTRRARVCWCIPVGRRGIGTPGATRPAKASG